MAVLAMFIGLSLSAPAHEHEGDGKHKEAASGKQMKVTGEVIDLVCYIDHGATGSEHADCAKKCIEMGLPVGLKGTDGTTYMLVGEHKPMNDKLVEYAAKTITVEGKMVERDGIHMIENAKILND